MGREHLIYHCTVVKKCAGPEKSGVVQVQSFEISEGFFLFFFFLIFSLHGC